jgi:hypothetical protein
VINPTWAHAITTSGVRRRVTLVLQGERITLELIGDTTVGIVRSQLSADLRPNDVILVKRMDQSNTTILEYQFFPEGFAGAIRALGRIALVEGAKSEALARGATELTTSLSDLLKATEDRKLGWLFTPHLALMELFITARPETAERLKKENPRKVHRMLQRCLTLRDVKGRHNPHSKVLGVKSSVKRLRAMSARRMATANAALTTSITLGALWDTMHALVAEVKAEITNKLDANTWELQQNGHRNFAHERWLYRFAQKLTRLADEFKRMDMHPFAWDAQKVGERLRNAAVFIKEHIAGYKENYEEKAKRELQQAIHFLSRLEARFLVAEMLRLVGTARDERVKKLGLTVEPPVWNQVNAALEEARKAFGMEPIGTPTTASNREPEILLEFYYRALRETAEFYDTMSRNAA